MTEKHPEAYFASDAVTLEGLGPSYAALLAALPGVDVCQMLIDDPLLLFLDVKRGVSQLHDLWDLDEAALQNSETFELALAIRTLSKCDP
jgi:hypothetical protein